MRRVRTLVAGTALGFAALTLAVPAAYADAGPSSGSHDKSWSSSDEKDSKFSDHKEGDQKEGDHKEGEKRPHGGPHAGVGFLDDGASLATGGVLIAGGLGLGYYALRRRPAAGLANA
jgi:hypothetical protein